MRFWKKLFGLEGKKKAKFEVMAIDADGDGKVQDGTIWERSADLSVNLDETLAKAEKLLEEIAPAVKPVKKTTKKAAPTKKAPAKKTSSTKKPTTKSAPKKADPKKAKSKATKKK